VRLEEHKKVIAQLEKDLEGLKEFSMEVSQEQEQRDGVLDNLEQLLATYEVQLAGEIAKAMSTDEAERSPLVRGLRQQINALNGRITERKANPPQPTRTRTSRPNLEFQAIDGQLRLRRQELVALTTQIPLLDDTVAEKTKELASRRQLQEEANDLTLAFDEAEKEHKKLESAAKTYEISRELDTRGLKALRIVEPASVPLAKDGPKRGRLILTAILGGMLLAMTWLIIRTRMGRTLQTAHDVTFALGRADVVGIPMLKARNVRRFEAARSRGWN